MQSSLHASRVIVCTEITHKKDQCYYKHKVYADEKDMISRMKQVEFKTILRAMVAQHLFGHYHVSYFAMS